MGQRAIYLRLGEPHREKLWRQLVADEMRFRGYDDHQIDVAARVPAHTGDCYFDYNATAWDCWNEDGVSFHPVSDEYSEIVDIVGRTLARLEGEEP